MAKTNSNDFSLGLLIEFDRRSRPSGNPESRWRSFFSDGDHFLENLFRGRAWPAKQSKWSGLDGLAKSAPGLTKLVPLGINCPSRVVSLQENDSKCGEGPEQLRNCGKLMGFPEKSSGTPAFNGPRHKEGNQNRI